MRAISNVHVGRRFLTPVLRQHPIVAAAFLWDCFLEEHVFSMHISFRLSCKQRELFEKNCYYEEKWSCSILFEVYLYNILSFWTRFQNWGYVELREIDFPFKKFAVWSGCIAFADYLLENILGVYSFCCETYAELKQHLTLRLQSAIFWKSSGFCFSVHVCSTFTMKLNFVLFCVLSYRKSIHS